MKIISSLSDEVILAEIGERIAGRRLELHLTQAHLAKEACVGIRTLERVVSGKTAQATTLIRLFRVLDLLPNLDQMLPEPKPGPIDVLKRKGKPRKRASSGKKGSNKEDIWTWGSD
jgi:transcriptional regulator with XRE-family HTH domain